MPPFDVHTVLFEGSYRAGCVNEHWSTRCPSWYHSCGP